MATKRPYWPEHGPRKAKGYVQSQIEYLANHFYNRYRLRMLSEAPKKLKTNNLRDHICQSTHTLHKL